MDKIYESYQNTLISEAFKSSILSKMFKKVMTKQSKNYNYETREYEQGFDKSYQNNVRRALHDFVSNTDASKVPDEHVIELPVDTFRKKVNKKLYQGAVFLKDGLPIYYAKFFDDGTISYVSKVNGHFKDEKPKLSHALHDADSVIAMVNYEKYVKVGIDKKNARWRARDGAVALEQDYEIKQKNLERYKKTLAKAKIDDGGAQRVLDALIKQYNIVASDFSNVEFKAEDLTKYSVDKHLKMLEKLKKAIGDLQETMKNAGQYSWVGKKEIKAAIIDAYGWVAKANEFFKDAA